MTLLPGLRDLLDRGRKQGRSRLTTNPVPHPASLMRLSPHDQAAKIELVQNEIDRLTDEICLGTIDPGSRGRGAALRGLHKRQKRLEKLAAEFGFRREWRKCVRVKALARPVSLACH